MIAVDTNVLVYAHRREVEYHTDASDLLGSLAGGSRSWAIPWPCLYEFFSVVTNARIWQLAASTPHQAGDQIQAWLGSPTVRPLSEPAGFHELLDPVLRGSRVRGGVVHDARITAICLSHGVDELLTRDRDFHLFPELKTRDPFR
ncbi:MAG: VapC toxin family PIN domain ribonuclease [Gammaproteobacteria bacterium]|nr:VapC toxin family PIN domain ribonuclease [Gammaproteobacteria bacterium]